MGRIKGRGKPVRIEAGDRVQMVKATTWSGVSVPAGTLGTVEYDPVKRLWAVAWDGFPRLQANGYAYGFGVRGPAAYCPDFAQVVRRHADTGAAGMEDACGING